MSHTDRPLPSGLLLIRHGESAGNVAREKALHSGSHMIDIVERDMDVPLSRLGEEQSAALGWWIANLPDAEKPELLLSSPYLRAQETARIMAQAAGLDIPIRSDERLREKEFGALDRLTKAGIEARYPEQAKLRSAIGKFYYRPPDGESWCDVVLRLRSMFQTLCLDYPGKRVLIVSHQVVVLCFRYLIENLDERTLLAIDQEGDVANCAITEYRQEESRLELLRYNFVAPMERTGTPVTSKPDPVPAK